MRITPAQSDYVERVGRWWEQVGSRSAGRILGWLMICDPPHRSAALLAEELQLSTGSVSTQTNVLERVGLVERVTFPGDRASYYQLKHNVWVEMMRTESARIEDMKRLAEAGVAVLPGERPDRVTDLARVSDFFASEWPSLMQRMSDFLEVEKAR